MQRQVWYSKWILHILKRHYYRNCWLTRYDIKVNVNGGFSLHSLYLSTANENKCSLLIAEAAYSELCEKRYYLS